MGTNTTDHDERAGPGEHGHDDGDQHQGGYAGDGATNGLYGGHLLTLPRATDIGSPQAGVMARSRRKLAGSYRALWSSRQDNQSRTGVRSYSGCRNSMVNKLAPRATRASASATVALDPSFVEISISEVSRPTSSPCLARMPSFRSSVGASEKLCQMSACSATIRSVFFSPPPPTSTGMWRVGGGFSLSQRERMIGRSRASASSRLPAVPNS